MEIFMKLNHALSALALGFVTAGPVAAVEYNTGYFGNVAIEGYDPVAYFTEGTARQGKAEFSTEWEGVTWKFASAQNRDLFVSDPTAYAPQLGGLCTEGVAFGEITVNLTPTSFAIIDGKLYLNSATAFADLATNLPVALSKWDKVHDDLAH
jgi:YHS domain-containing protein